MLKFLHNTTWEEIFQEWKAKEGSDPAWIKVAQEVKGWPDWESWRRHSVNKIKADKRKWAIYKITDPMKFIPAMLIGPYNSWQKYFKNKNTASFSELFDAPEVAEVFKKNKRVLEFLENFPAQTQFIGLQREDNGKVVLLEGHHRAAAVALVKKQKRIIKFTGPITIALAPLGRDEIKLLDETLVQGSAR